MADSYGKVSNISGYDELRKVARSGERIVDTQALLKKIKESRKPKLGPKERPKMIDRDRDKIPDTIDADSRPQVIQKLNQIYSKGKKTVDEKIIEPAKKAAYDIEDAQLRAKYLKDLEEQERLASGESAEVETKAEFQARMDAKRKQDNPPVSEEIPDSEQVTYENRLKGAKADVQESIKDIKSAPGELAKDFKEQIADPIDRGLRTSPNLRLLKRGVLPMTMMKRGEIYELLGEVLNNQDISEEDRNKMIADIQQELRYSSSMAGSREGTEQRPNPVRDRIKRLFDTGEESEEDNVEGSGTKTDPIQGEEVSVTATDDAQQNEGTQDNPKQKAVIDTIKKFEGGNRSDTHNNPGAVIYTPGMEKIAEELGISIERGKEFKGSDGREYNTIQFASKDDGAALLSKLIETKMSDPKFNNFTSKDDVKKFVEEYTGLDADSSTVNNYTDDMWKNMSKIKGGFISMRSN
tara:strand:+ start:25346 stop:26743 length:1398 start_codon:yes stop_codon:yes gene_type:complete